MNSPTNESTDELSNEVRNILRDARTKEAAFRRGATHSSQWMREQVRTMAEAGRSGVEIASRLNTLHQVLLDWRNEQFRATQNFELNPWNMSQKELGAYIEEHSSQW